MLTTILMGLGSLIAFIGAIWLLVLAFKKSIVWGLASLFIGPVLLVFAIMNWGDCKKPFLIWLGGFALIMVAVVMGGAEMYAQMPPA